MEVDVRCDWSPREVALMFGKSKQFYKAGATEQEISSTSSKTHPSL